MSKLICDKSRLNVKFKNVKVFQKVGALLGEEDEMEAAAGSLQFTKGTLKCTIVKRGLHAS